MMQQILPAHNASSMACKLPQRLMHGPTISLCLVIRPTGSGFHYSGCPVRSCNFAFADPGHTALKHTRPATDLSTVIILFIIRYNNQTCHGQPHPACRHFISQSAVSAKQVFRICVEFHSRHGETCACTPLFKRTRVRSCD